MHESQALTHSWGAAQVADCGAAIDGGSVFASSSEAALPDLANVSEQSSGPDRGHRLFTVPTSTFRILFVVVVLSHHRRQVLHFGVTAQLSPQTFWTLLHELSSRLLLPGTQPAESHVGRTWLGNKVVARSKSLPPI